MNLQSKEAKKMKSLNFEDIFVSNSMFVWAKSFTYRIPLFATVF